MVEVAPPDEAFGGISFVRSNPFIQNDLRKLGSRGKSGETAVGLSSQREINNLSSSALHSFSSPPPPFTVEEPSTEAVTTAPPPVMSGTTAIVLPGRPESPPSDVEYGPGIVQKLKAKFTQLSKDGSSTARVSPHLPRKRFSSVDDILTSESSSRYDGRNTDEFRTSDHAGDDEQWLTHYKIPKKAAPKAFDIDHSSSLSNFGQEKPVARAVTSGILADQNLNDQEITGMENQREVPISALKQKFEHVSRAKAPASFKTFAATMTSRRAPRSQSATPHGSTGIKQPFIGDDAEPEFIRIHRRLKGPNRGELDQSLNESIAVKPVERITRRIGEAKKHDKSPESLGKPLGIALPKLSRAARLIVLSPTEMLEKARISPRPASILDLISPPDPDSARCSPSKSQNDQQSYVFSPALSMYECDRSPPPEEPKPPSNANDSEALHGRCVLQKNFVQESGRIPIVLDGLNPKLSKITYVDSTTTTITSKPSLLKDDGSGINEMRRLLSKFSVIREQKNVAEQEQAVEQEPVAFSVSKVPPERQMVTATSKPVAIPEKRSAPPPPVAAPVAPNQVVRKPKPFVPAPRPTDSLQRRVTSSSRENVEVKDVQPTSKETGRVLVHPAQSKPTGVKTTKVSNFSSVSTALRPNVVTITINDAAPTKTQKTDADVSSVPKKAPAPQRPHEPALQRPHEPAHPPAVTAQVDTTSAFSAQKPQKTDEPEDRLSVNETATLSSSSIEKSSAQETQRRSLSSKFFESKSQPTVQDDVANAVSKPPLENIVRRPKPYGDDATELLEKPPDFACVITSSSDEEMDETPLSGLISEGIVANADDRSGTVAVLLEKFSRQHIAEEDAAFQERPSFPPYMAFTAGDGNPVRHSLINLVMEEDVPLLMEAMAEKLEFEFEDLAPVPSSSSEGIIRNLSSQHRGKARNGSRIGFSESPPTVFSYPDETTAVELPDWHPGEDITFDEYQQICEEERVRFEEEKFEASKWQASFLANNAAEIMSVTEQPTVNDFALGVTSRISYATASSYNSNNNNFGPTNISLIAGK